MFNIPQFLALANALLTERTQAILALRAARAELDSRASHILLRALGLRRDWDRADAYAVHLAAPSLLTNVQAYLCDSGYIKEILLRARDLRKAGVTEGTITLPGRVGLHTIIQAERLGVEL